MALSRAGSIDKDLYEFRQKRDPVNGSLLSFVLLFVR